MSSFGRLTAADDLENDPIFDEMKGERRGVNDNHNVMQNSPSNPSPALSYPGRDSVLASKLFITLYEEEEFYERAEQVGGLIPSASLQRDPPSVYCILRLLDSIRGFHKGHLDLGGRHPKRYYTLQSEWNEYLCDFMSLEGGSRSCNAPGIQDRYCAAELWRSFQTKWRLPNSASYCQLLKCTQSVLRDLTRQPVPQFQTLRLMHLPIEILDNIFSLASATLAKALASTCRRLNDIGHRHIFRTWQAKFHVQPGINPVHTEYSTFDFLTLSEYARADLFKNFEFLLTNPRVSHQIQKIVFADEWWVHRRAHPHEDNPFILSVDFYRSIFHIFGTVLRTMPRLTTLVLCNLEINVDLAQRISDILTLHTLDLHLCRVSKLVRKRLLHDSAPLSSQIANLRIYMDSSFHETQTQWYTLLLCPNIRTLTIVQFGVGPFVNADTAFWDKCRLGVLERLSLDNVDSVDLAEFAEWFFANSAVSGTHLTHFKLHIEWGLPDSEVIALLLALQRAPLQVLVLEGLAEAEFALFEHIARQHPNLIALTLVRRQQGNQHQNKLVIWPHASWEYASCFKDFKALRHFCWNFLTEYWDATPTLLLAFESNFSSSEKRLGHNPTDDLPYFLDTHLMALPFAAYCPALESFSLMDRDIDMVCRVVRNKDHGGISLAPKYFPVNSCNSWNTHRWNTTASHWPILLPSRTAR